MPIRNAGETPLDALAQGQHVAVAAERPPQYRRVLGARVLGVYALAVIVLGVVTLAAYSGRSLGVDVAITRFEQSYTAVWYTWILTNVSSLGFFPGNVLTYVVIVTALVSLRLWREALMLVAATLSASGVTAIVKRVIARPRPTPNLVHVAAHLRDPSFPSGHVVQYTVLFGFVFFVVITTWQSSLPRNVVLVVCALLILLVGPSRVFLGEHWASDTLGAYLLAGVWLGLAIEVYVRFVISARAASPPRAGLLAR